MNKIFDFTHFDESDNKQHASACSRVLSTCYRLRDSDKKIKLDKHQFEISQFPKEHDQFPSLQYVALTHLKPTKNDRLSYRKPYLTEFDKKGRLPVLSNGSEGDVARDAGGKLLRWLEKLEDNDQCQRFF